MSETTFNSYLNKTDSTQKTGMTGFSRDSDRLARVIKEAISAGVKEAMTSSLSSLNESIRTISENQSQLSSQIEDLGERVTKLEENDVPSTSDVSKQLGAIKNGLQQINSRDRMLLQVDPKTGSLTGGVLSSLIHSSTILEKYLKNLPTSQDLQEYTKAQLQAKSLLSQEMRMMIGLEQEEK